MHRKRSALYSNVEFWYTWHSAFPTVILMVRAETLNFCDKIPSSNLISNAQCRWICAVASGFLSFILFYLFMWNLDGHCRVVENTAMLMWFLHLLAIQPPLNQIDFWISVGAWICGWRNWLKTEISTMLNFWCIWHHYIMLIIRFNINNLKMLKCFVLVCDTKHMVLWCSLNRFSSQYTAVTHGKSNSDVFN